MTLLLISSGALVAISVALHHSSVLHRVEMIHEAEVHAVDMRRDAVVRILESIVSDLTFLAHLNELAPFLRSQGDAQRDPLVRELLAFAQRQEAYAQIRVVSLMGNEILRIDSTRSMPAVIPQEELRDVKERIGFRELARCSPGTIYVSGFHSSSADASQPMMQMGLPFDDDGTTAGYLLLEVSGSTVAEAYFRAYDDPSIAALLVDASGTWPDDLSQWGGPRPAAPEGAGVTFPARFPAEWATISSSETGQMMTSNGLFTYDTIAASAEAQAAQCAMAGGSPDGATEGTSWKGISWIPAAALMATRRAGVAKLVGWNVLGILILGGGSWPVARWYVKGREHHRRTATEKELAESTLKKYMDPKLYHRLLSNPARHARLGGESQDVAVLFADLRGFTGFAERHDPDFVVAVLNRTLTELTAHVRTYGGILDKYIGDGFLVFFESTSELPDALRHAVAAATVMQRVFRNLWADSDNEALLQLGLGIGISAGRVVVGNIGSEHAMDYTIVGDAVNVASRLQGLAAAGEILISEPGQCLLDGQGDFEPVQQLHLRGRSQPVNVFRYRTGTEDR